MTAPVPPKPGEEGGCDHGNRVCIYDEPAAPAGKPQADEGVAFWRRYHHGAGDGCTVNPAPCGVLSTPWEIAHDAPPEDF